MKEKLSRNMYKGPMDKAKGGLDRGWEVGMAVVGGSGRGGKKKTTPKLRKVFCYISTNGSFLKT